jgi:anthranilate synthase component II
MLLMIDNYDSFTYNLLQYFGELKQEVKVYRNDAISIEQIIEINPSHICISPGPCSPSEAGISIDVIRYFAGKKPILGVCLGHQAIAQAFGANIIRARQVMHGKVSKITQTLSMDSIIFKGLPQQFNVTRYHSLAIEEASLDKNFYISSRTDDGEIMSIEHKSMQIYGVQFHPEAILSEHGHAMLANFVDL